MIKCRTALSSALLLYGLLIAACGSSNGTNGSDNGIQPKRYAAFNTGLNEWVTFLEERRPLVLDVLYSLDVDVLCLSGVYDDSDADEIITRLKDKLPYAYSEKTSDSTEKKIYCSDGDALIATQKCNQDECLPIGLSPGDCVTTVCRELWDNLSKECRYCISAHPDDPVSCLTGDAQQYAMNGRNGMLLLSRDPIKNTSVAMLGTMTVQRALLSGIIGETAVHCTLFTMDLPQVPYPEELAPHASWEEEHRATVQKAIELTSSADGCTMLMGDLGAGPAASTVDAHFGENYQLLLDAGFEEPWSDRQCTLCKENPLVRPTTDRQVDHLLFRNCPDHTSMTYTRIFDDPIMITDRQGAEQVTSLAANYGLLFEVR